MTPLRWTLAAASAISLIVIVLLWVSASGGTTILKETQFNDLVAAAIQLKLEQSRSEFHVGLVVAAALWALLIGKADEARLVLSDTQELVMFASGSMLLLASFACHILYLDQIGYVYSLAGGLSRGKDLMIPDVFAPAIDNPYRFQFWFLVAGIAVSAVTIFSAHKLKK